MRRSAPATLRRIWITSALQLVAIIIGLGALAMGTTWYSTTVFHETTSHVENEMNSLTTLKTAIVAMSKAATPVMYGFEGSSTAEENLASYTAASARLTAEFEAAEQVFVTAESRAILHGMIVTWRAVDAVVVGAPALHESGALTEMMAAGADPFVDTVWAPYNEMDLGLGELGTNSARELRGRISDFDRVQRLITPVVLGAVALALLMSWAAARRIARRVLTPLSTLRHAAVAMSESHLEQLIVLTGAASELHDLARTINETSASLRATHDVLRDQADSDVLTGLPNRRAFTELLERTLAAANSGRVGVLFIDLDDFKIVNDSLGHAAGDELLRVVAGRLRAVVRDGDTVARLGGDEFAVVLRSDTAAAAAVAVAERALATMQEPVVIDGTPAEVGCSIGLALSPEGSGAEAAAELVRNADFAMYMAKSQGKNRFEVFAPAMHAEMLDRMELKQDLGQAARLGQFVLDYQPVVELDTRALLGFEALVSWQHPTRGRLAPAEFIALAEDTTDIVAIGEWVIDQACRALAEHHRQHPGGRPPWMSVNVSPVEITHPGFVTTVCDALERHGISPQSLIIEITEGVAMTNTGAAALVLSELREVGVQVALDDFGTGFPGMAADGDAFIVTDNDGLDDAVGQAVFVNLGADALGE